jgi:plastocyanin
MVSRQRSRARGGAAARRAAAIGVAAIAVAAIGGGGVSWAAEPIRASALSNTYTEQTYDMAAGEVPTFRNDSVGNIPHDVAATANGPDGRFLFKSEVIDSNRSTPVRGTQYLAPGTYRFLCTIHGSGMAANLQVGPGNPVPRPRLQVADSGSDARGVVLLAKVGGAKVATERGVAVPAGARRKLTMSLTRRGRDALEGRERAVVTVKAAVDFARPDTARRGLH